MGPHEELNELESDKLCEGCSETIIYGDSCIQLRLVHPARINGETVLLDALNEDDGDFTADPLLYCCICWDTYSQDLHRTMQDMFVSKKRSAEPSEVRCNYCQTRINWGEYCAYAIYGALDVSPRTKDTIHVPCANETVADAEILCLDCVERINEAQDESIWDHLYCVDEEGPDDQEGT